MEKKGKKKAQNASKKSDWQRLKRPQLPPDTEQDIMQFRLQIDEQEGDMRHPYVKDLYKNYRRLRKKQEKIIGTKKKLIERGGDRSQLNKDQIEQLDGEAAVFAQMWEIVDRNEAYQESVKNANVTIRVEEPGETEKKEEVEEKKEVTLVTRNEKQIRDEEREATSKGIIELVADIFLSQSAMETIMSSQTFPRTESDYYAFAYLLNFNYVRSPLQFQQFGGSAQAMHAKLSAFLLKLYQRSQESVDIQGVSPKYTYQDLRAYISRLTQFARENLVEEYNKFVAQRQAHFQAAQPMYPMQAPEPVDVEQKEQEEKVEDMTRGIMDDEQPAGEGQEQEEEEEEEEEKPQDEAEEEQHQPQKEEPKEPATWADEDDDEEVEDKGEEHGEQAGAEELTEEQPRYEEPQQRYEDQEQEHYPRGGTVRAGRYYTKYPGRHGGGGYHYGAGRGRGGWKGEEEQEDYSHHKPRGYHYHNRSRGGGGRGYRRGGTHGTGNQFVDSDEEVDHHQKQVDDEGYQFVKDPSEKKKSDNPYGYRQYGGQKQQGYGRGYRSNRGGYRGDQGGYRGDQGGYRGDHGGYRGDGPRGGYRGDHGPRGGHYGQKRGGWNKRGGRGGYEEYGEGEQFHGGEQRHYGGRGYEKQEAQE